MPRHPRGRMTGRRHWRAVAVAVTVVVHVATAARRVAGQTAETPLSTGMIQPRACLAASDPARAVVLLEAARSVKPESGSVCFDLAGAYAMLDRREEVLEALDCAVDNGWRGPEAIDTRPEFEAIRADPAFDDLVRRFRHPQR